MQNNPGNMNALTPQVIIENTMPSAENAMNMDSRLPSSDNEPVIAAHTSNKHLAGRLNYTLAFS